MKKNVIVALTAGTLLFGGIIHPSITSNALNQNLSISSVQSQQTIYFVVSDKELSGSLNGAALSGTLPVVTGLSDESLQKQINDQIEDLLDQNTRYLAEPNPGNISVDVSYEVKQDNDQVSILIYFLTGSKHPFTVVKSVNFIGGDNGKLITLNNVGDISTIERRVKTELYDHEDPIGKYDHFYLREDTAFYIENGQLNLVPNQEEFFASNEGTPTISIPLKDIDYNSLLNSEIKVILDGELLSFPEPPVIKNGTTLVPMKQIFQALGADVHWNNNTKTVYGEKFPGESYSLNFSLTIGDKTASVNNQKVELLQPGELINNKTFVPLRFVSEALGADVQWDQNTKTVTIYTKYL
ncbi:stalk domain-containing protein [Chengkuizengella axinellae]|uniref:Stalk domain-containing protein n=1 Tax=Chengkuizengella axinellae TaxID=3064388 RepID=A0ABT9J4T8_9BACL|nr:stalk domain-containing protein [Chengkuizengella sp. 2205SS18-9]MDP5275954.1 stalk domain-containing protein [Chengkuizengella sp. 2205SS18-9]